ncbi:MAG: hypothetical protein WDM71_04900 [Ferruginibacter sp.]
MKKQLSRVFLLAVCFLFCVHVTDAQTKKRKAVKRGATTRKTTRSKTKATISPAAQVDSVATVKPVAAIVKDTVAVNDSLPIPRVKPSLRRDEAVITDNIRDRTPLTYTYLRADDAVYRHRIWREIDAREKINLPFRYAG